MGVPNWLDPGQAYGGSIAKRDTAPITPDATGLSTVAPTPTPALGGFLSPKDPMFWFGVFAAGTVAAMAYSTVSPIKA